MHAVSDAMWIIECSKKVYERVICEYSTYTKYKHKHKHKQIQFDQSNVVLEN